MTNKLSLFLMLLGACAVIPLFSFVTQRASEPELRGGGDPGAAILASAARHRRSDVSVEASGIVETIGESAGTTTQRFVIRLPTDMAVAVVHEVGQGSAVPLRMGDRVRVRGRYHWNEDGGSIVGTHNDPGMTHAGGWILHRGKFYPPTPSRVVTAQPGAAPSPID